MSTPPRIPAWVTDDQTRKPRTSTRRDQKRRDNLIITLACLALLLALWALMLAADARTLALVGIHGA